MGSKIKSALQFKLKTNNPINKSIFFGALIALFILVSSSLLAVSPKGQNQIDETESQKKNEVEEIFYQLNYKGFKIGQAKMVLYSDMDLEGKDTILITFETDTAFFDDTERVFIQKDTLLPIRVERDISQFGRRYSIREDYDQLNFTVKVHKEGEDVVTINKKQNIHNPISAIYYVRRLERFEKGGAIPLIFPLIELKTNLENIENINLPKGKFSALLFKSIPDRFSFWLSNDERRLPLKLEVQGAFGYSALMTEVRYIPYEEFMKTHPEVKEKKKFRDIVGIVPKMTKNLYEAIKGRISGIFKFRQRESK